MRARLSFYGEASHFSTIQNLADQMKKFILKHKDNPNSVINDVSISLFISFSEAFAEDGDPETNGLNMLSKLIDKVKVLMKSYDDLVPEEGKEFDLTPEDEEDMQTTLDSEGDEDEEESEDEDLEDSEEEESDEDEDSEELDDEEEKEEEE